MNPKKVLLFLSLMLPLPLFGSMDIQFEIEREIEEITRKQINPLVDEHQVFVHVELTEEVAIARGKKGKLPYSQLQLDDGTLQRLYLKNRKQLLFTTGVKVSVTFDEGVSPDLVELVKGKLTQSLRMDGTKRILTVNAVRLSPIPPSPPAPIQNSDEALKIDKETAELESERVRLELERQKMQAGQERAALEDRIKEIEAELKKAKDEVIRTPEASDANEERSIYDTVKEFQLLILAVIASLALLLTALISSSARKAAPKLISKAIESIGEGIASLAAARSSGEGDSESSAEHKPLPGELPVSERGQGELGEPEPDRAQIEQFLQLIEEKIKILSREGNFGFFKYFLDMVESNIDLAAAILVVLPNDLSKKLLGSISVDHINNIRSYLMAPGALVKAKRLRAVALQEFYGKIAIDEYMGSPLLEIKNIDWLAKLDTTTLVDLLVELDEQDRVRMLACLSPARVNHILEETKVPEKVQKLIGSLRGIKEVGFSDVEGLFERAKKTYEGMRSSSEETFRKLVDAPQYLAEILKKTNPNNRAELLHSLQNESELLLRIRKYYIPFQDIARIRLRILKDIFGKRNANQVALAVFDMSKDIQRRVISLLPEVLGETVKEEIETIQNDAENKAVYDEKSQKIKDEICKTLLKMNQDGLLEYEESDGAVADTGIAAA